MDCDHYTMREKVGLEPVFPVPIRACLLSVIESIGQAEAAAAFRRDEHDRNNLDGLMVARIRESLPPQWQLRIEERVAQGPNFANDFSLVSTGAVVSVEVEKDKRGRFDLDLIKILAFAIRQFPAPAFGVLIVSRCEVLPRDVTGSRHETAFHYLGRTLRLLWHAQRGNLEDVLVIGYDEGEEPEPARPKNPPVKDEQPSSGGSGIVVGTQDRDLEEIAQIIGPPRGEVFRQSQALREIRRLVLQDRVGVIEKLNQGPLKYLGYRVRDKDRAYVYVQNDVLVVDLDITRTDENLQPLRNAGIEVAHRNNFMGRSGWLTGIRLPHSASLEQISIVAEVIVYALTRDRQGD